MATEEDSPREAKTPRTASLDDDDDERQALVSRITSNGTTREAVTPQTSIAGAWSADLILRLEQVSQLVDDTPDAGKQSQAAGAGVDGDEGEKGGGGGGGEAVFELWLGSLEDALNLRRLAENNINAVLNCALDSCETELAPFRPVGRGRPRSHTRSMSLSDDGLENVGGDFATGKLFLHRDQVWAEAALNEDWYSEAMGYDFAYHSFAAEDEADYDLKQHFDEATAFLESCRREGRRTLVHCVMGLNRAPACMTAFLCQGLGYNLDVAVDIVSRNRGLVLSNQGFLDSLVATYGSKQKRNSAVAHVFSDGGASSVVQAVQTEGSGL